MILLVNDSWKVHSEREDDFDIYYVTAAESGFYKMQLIDDCKVVRADLPAVWIISGDTFILRIAAVPEPEPVVKHRFFIKEFMLMLPELDGSLRHRAPYVRKMIAMLNSLLD